MKKMHLFMVKFLSPTNINGSRIKITSALYNKSKIISYDYQGRTDEQAAAYLNSLGYDIQFIAEDKKCYYLMSSVLTPFNVRV